MVRHSQLDGVIFVKFQFITYRAIQFSLHILATGRKAYNLVRQMLKLPSVRHLQRIKNFVKQKPGIQPDQLHWMDLEARRRGTTDRGRKGSLILDEMQIEV